MLQVVTQSWRITDNGKRLCEGAEKEAQKVQFSTTVA